MSLCQKNILWSQCITYSFTEKKSHTYTLNKGCFEFYRLCGLELSNKCVTYCYDYCVPGSVSCMFIEYTTCKENVAITWRVWPPLWSDMAAELRGTYCWRASSGRSRDTQVHTLFDGFTYSNSPLRRVSWAKRREMSWSNTSCRAYMWLSLPPTSAQGPRISWFPWP